MTTERCVVDLRLAQTFLTAEETVHLVRVRRTDISAIQRIAPILRSFGAGVKILVMPEIETALSLEETSTEMEDRLDAVRSEEGVQVLIARDKSIEPLVVLRPKSLAIEFCATMNRIQLSMGCGTPMLVIPAIGCDIPGESEVPKYESTDLRPTRAQVWPLKEELFGLLSLLDSELNAGIAPLYLKEKKHGEGKYGWAGMRESFFGVHKKRVVAAGLPCTEEGFRAVYEAISQDFRAVVGRDTPSGQLPELYALHSHYGVIRT